MNTILNVEKICKSFGKNKVLNEVSFKIKKGQILGFIGPNGAGKTTAIKLILGLQLMDSGEVYINNYNIKKDYENAIAKVGAIVENPDLYLFLTGRQNLRLFSRYYGEVDEKYLDYLLEKVNLIERADDKVSNYSLGMRQRLGIAVSLINHPNLLVLDEPTNGLDPEGIKDLRDIIIKLAKTENIGVLISSHNLAELDGFCNRICLIDKGQIIKDINLDTLKNSEKPVFFIKLDKLSKIDKYLVKGDKVLENGISVSRSDEDISKLIKELVLDGYNIYEVRRELLSLEEAYLKIMEGNL